ncbi:hypothetical protein ARMSODRAFT_1017523 [Armillaria solidipes]|uniref:Uncharacterized protein n=2 Tax=Armillaria TaxID=47424 RepID=A0A2H3C3L9_9AGAR|nr:hypothetical protein ARMSODRAFT_1017523 [Armillaria solidipes]
MSAPQTQYAPTQSSSVLGGQIVGRSERQAAPPAALKLRLDLNLEVEIAIQAKVNGDITLSLLELIVVLECTGRLVSCQSSVFFDVLMVDGRCTGCAILTYSAAFQSIFDQLSLRVTHNSPLLTFNI